jgi:hypothetical protein
MQNLVQGEVVLPEVGLDLGLDPPQLLIKFVLVLHGRRRRLKAESERQFEILVK